MVEVRLHGALAKEFGKVWHFEISTPAEAVAALDVATRRAFRKAILRLSQAGMVFKVKTKIADLEKDDLNLHLQSGDRIDFVPIVVGANGGTRFVVGAVLIAASFYAGGPTSPVGAYMFNAGVALMAGSVMEYMTRVQKPQDEQYKNQQSWTISGPVQTTEQGVPIPVIYGEVLASGYTVSAGLLSAQTIDPEQGLFAGTILCENSYSASVGAPNGGWTIVFQPSIRLEAVAPPFTFLWSVSSSASISSSIVNGTSATPTITLTGGDGYLNENITVSVAITGFDPVLLENPAPLNTTVNKTVQINVQAYINAGGA